MAVAMAVREARLLPQWAHLYPGLEPGGWTVAAQLVPLVLRNRLEADRTWEFTRRILVDEHFEFRGGRPRKDPLSAGGYNKTSICFRLCASSLV